VQQKKKECRNVKSLFLHGITD